MFESCLYCNDVERSILKNRVCTMHSTWAAEHFCFVHNEYSRRNGIQTKKIEMDRDNKRCNIGGPFEYKVILLLYSFKFIYVEPGILHVRYNTRM